MLLYILYVKTYNHGDMYTLNLIILDIFKEGIKYTILIKKLKREKWKSGRENVSTSNLSFHLSVDMFIKYMVYPKIKA